MKKKLGVFIILFAVCLCSFTSLPAYAANSGGGGVSIDTGESTAGNANLYGRKISAGDKMDLIYTMDTSSYEAGSYTKYVAHIDFLDGNASIVGFTYFDKNSGDCDILFYSKESFEFSYYLTVTNHYEGNEDEPYNLSRTDVSSRLDSSSGLYIGGFFSGSGYPWTISCVPSYNLDLSGNRDTILSQLADGTFKEEHEDDFIGGTEEPDFNQDEANYNPSLGYLKGIHYFHIKSPDIEYPKDISRDEMQHREGYKKTLGSNNPSLAIKFNQYSSSNFDLTKEGIYIRVFDSLCFRDKSDSEYVYIGERRFFKSFGSSNLQISFPYYDLDMVVDDIYHELLGDPVFYAKAKLYGYRRVDSIFLQLTYWNGSEWEYGDFVKLYITSNGDMAAITITPDGDVLPDSNTDVDLSEGEGDTIEDGIENSVPVNPGETFTDFESMLDALTHGLMDFPELVGKVFSFLPKEFVTMLVAGLSCVIVLRILGR